MDGSYGYGIWGVAVVSAVMLSLFAYGLLKPARKREWRGMGVLQAFFVALYAEMYGFPLTIFVLNSVLGIRFPTLLPFAHESGHLLATLGVGLRWAALVCQAGNAFMLIGAGLMGVGWHKIAKARGGLVVDGIYRYMRHPQYAGLFLLIVGALVQWPTIPTVIMGPVLMVMYYRLALREERDLAAAFGDEYTLYRERTPRFLPSVGKGNASRLSY